MDSRSAVQYATGSSHGPYRNLHNKSKLLFEVAKQAEIKYKQAKREKAAEMSPPETLMFLS